MDIALWLKVAMLSSAFVLGAAMVHRHSRRKPGTHRAGAAMAVTGSPATRPPAQIPVRSLDGIVEATDSGTLLGSVERKTRFSKANFERDCLPVLQCFAEFVQMLPASEAHHHAQPGGLWLHALEVLDAALTFRAGMELPAGVGTEERKRVEHRWTFAIFAAALLHDVGKPVTDVRVTLFGEDARAGRPWAPLAGPMRAFGAHWYSVAFADPSERDYLAHGKLAAMLLHSFVPARVLRWLSEDSDVLTQLLAYLSGEDKEGPIGTIIKRADSDSVRRNLLYGPRTRFTSARARPLVERLMEALRRMLVEGAILPLNRPGAAGWVYEGKVWFVCARLADEVRNYLSQHESLQGVPGKDKNDRLFDTWQEYGAAETAPDGGAIWRVRVECDGWSPPDTFTVLCFSIEKLYPDATMYPSEMKGRVWVPHASSGGAGTAATSAASPPATPPSAPKLPQLAVPAAPRPATTLAVIPGQTALGAKAPDTAVLIRAAVPVAAIQLDGVTAAEAGVAQTPVAVEAVPLTAPAAPASGPESATSATAADDDTLAHVDSAGAEAAEVRATTTPELGQPLRPREKGQRPPGSAGRAPSPAATALMAWVAQSVGSGALKYNEDGALVHFVPEGALLLTPEIFRRFLSEHASVPDGPIAALRESHGDRAFARLQNELAKSGWTVRNGDENMHYYAFVKADKSLSRTASFCLVGKPELFWNPVPAPNDRITRAPRPKRMALPVSAASARKGPATTTRSAA